MDAPCARADSGSRLRRWGNLVPENAARQLGRTFRYSLLALRWGVRIRNVRHVDALLPHGWWCSRSRIALYWPWRVLLPERRARGGVIGRPSRPTGAFGLRFRLPCRVEPLRVCGGQRLIGPNGLDLARVRVLDLLGPALHC